MMDLRFFKKHQKNFQRKSPEDFEEALAEVLWPLFTKKRLSGDTIEKRQSNRLNKSKMNNSNLFSAEIDKKIDSAAQLLDRQKFLKRQINFD